MEGVFQVEQVAGAKALSQERVWLGLRTPGGIWKAENKWNSGL